LAEISEKSIRCPAPTGFDYFLAANAILRFEESHYAGTAFVVMSLPRSQESRVLVMRPVAWLEEQYFAVQRFCEWPRPDRFK
jgi:hypothetical protein